ncbi:ParB/RepB/Spo0J family partition protein [Streptomyces sp. bgisy126]|uniref:ParB/RepB/Spo0J family partition protein n=1 Tax=unclassified Streptomyces TaxID=2593676 RepID=UPI003EBC262C
MNTVRAGAFPGTGGEPEPSRAPLLTAVHLVPVAALHPADSPRARTEHPEHLRILAAAEGELPPIVVHRESMRVVDGTHRLRAAVLRGRTEVEVRFFDGGAEDAFVYAVEANTRHGLPLSLAERQAAAARILASHPHWADRAIASVSGLSAHTVAALRRSAPGPDAPAGRLGRDGRVRPLSTAQGRREAGRLLAASPDVSLREIAKRTGLSPATVRDVRDRVRRGEDPVPERLRGGDGGRAEEPGREPGPWVRAVPSPAPVPAAAQTPAPAPEEELAAAYQNLCRDPALRHTESGRVLLRLLSALTLPPAQWQTLADGVPVHRAGAVAELASEYARVWQEFAERARRGEERSRRDPQ